jgi:hypothetical protein
MDITSIAIQHQHLFPIPSFSPKIERIEKKKKKAEQHEIPKCT